MPGILRKSRDSNKGTKARLVRDILIYLMRKDLDLEVDDIATFLGYSLYRVHEGLRRIERAVLDKVDLDGIDVDEDIICAVDMVREERDLRTERD